MKFIPMLLGLFMALAMIFISNMSAIAADKTYPTNQNPEGVITSPPPLGKMNNTTTENSGNHDNSQVTPTDQSLNSTDVETTRRIRETLTADSSLSTSAQNVKIITTRGVITLRGAVKSSAEHQKVLAAVEKFRGTNSVNDRLAIETR